MLSAFFHPFIAVPCRPSWQRRAEFDTVESLRLGGIRVRPDERQRGRVGDEDGAPLRKIGRGFNRVIRSALAADVKLNCPPAAETLLRLGAESGFTTTEKLCVALMLGVPLSETVSVKLFVEFACVTSGRNENAPLPAFTLALVGPLNRLNVSVCGGWSVSVALAVKATVWPTFTV